MSSPDAPKRVGNHVAIVLAIVAIVLSLGPYVFQDRAEWPGISFVRFLDSNSGEPIGFMRAEYGALTIGQFKKKSDGRDEFNRVELQLRDDGLMVELQKDGASVGRWSLTQDTDTLTRIGGAAKP